MLKFNRNLRCNTKRIYCMWSAKAGSATFGQTFFEYVGFDYEKNSFIHKSMRSYEKLQKETIPLLKLDNYLCLQLVRNSYARAASSYMVSKIRNFAWYTNNKYAYIPNNVKFVEFLMCLKDIFINNKLTLDPHYMEQCMPNSQYVIDNKGLIYLESYKKDIENINQRENINLNSNVVYNVHAAEKCNKHYIAYEELYKDKKAKILVEELYQEDIEKFKFTYPY